MSYLVVVLLSLLWLGFFLPGLLQARRSSPLASASTFQESLARISTGRAVDSERTDPPVARRRSRREIARQRDVLAVLTAVVLGTIVLAVMFGGPARWLVVPSTLALAGYLAMLRTLAVQSQAAARRRPHAQPRPAPPAPTDDDVVPSVRRRVASDDLERIAG